MPKSKRSYYAKGPLARFWGKINPGNETTEENLPDKQALEYLESSYPSNHNYVLNQGQLIALRKLEKRYRDIAAFYPEDMQSLLDISCSKGYFVFDAILSYGCKRSMGIDVLEHELDACATVQKYLNDDIARFEQIRLHELANRIEDFGGPFDAVLVINCYQHLYFGSSRFVESYMSHDRIFRNLREVCNGRVIFSNRIDVDHLQDYPANIAKGPNMKETYDEAMVFTAASKYFKVKRAGKLGRYPLWTLDAH
jgi:hypothetical protein